MAGLGDLTWSNSTVTFPGSAVTTEQVAMVEATWRRQRAQAEAQLLAEHARRKAEQEAHMGATRQRLEAVLAADQWGSYREGRGVRERAPSGRWWFLNPDNTYVGFGDDEHTVRARLCVYPSGCVGSTVALGLLMWIRAGQEEEIIGRGVLIGGYLTPAEQETQRQYVERPRW